MTRKSSLVAEVLSLAAAPRRGSVPWYQKLPPEAREELEAVRQAFTPGVHELNAYARAVMAAADERGWQTSGIQGVIAWLRKKP